MTIFIARDTETLVSSTAETIVQVLASTKPLRIKEIGVSFNGTDASLTPATVDLLRQTTAGTSSSLTLVENQEIGETALATATKDFTAEPTAGDILGTWYVTVAGGLFVMQYPLGDEPVVAPSGRLAIRVTPPASTPVVAAYIKFDE